MRLLVRPLSIVGAVVAVAVATAPAAWADAGQAIVNQCTRTGTVSDTYSQQAYSEALNDLGADASEYTDCAQLIRQAQLAAAARSRGGGGGGAGTGGGGSVPSASFSPTERADAKSLDSPRTGGAPVAVGGQIVHPGVVNADLAAAVSTIPAPLLAVLAILGAAAVLAVARLLRNRVGPGRPD